MYLSTLTLAGSINSFWGFQSVTTAQWALHSHYSRFGWLTTKHKGSNSFHGKKTPKTFQNRYQLTIWTILTNFAIKSIQMDDDIANVYHLVGFVVLIKVVSNNSCFILAILICSLWFAFNRQRIITSLIKKG